MLETLNKIVTWLFEFWSKVPESQKQRILSFVVESFDALLRAYFQSSRKESAA